MEIDGKDSIEGLEQNESFKLIKNSRGYNWEIKLLALRGELGDKHIERMAEIEKLIAEKWGVREEETDELS